LANCRNLGFNVLVTSFFLQIIYQFITKPVIFMESDKNAGSARYQITITNIRDKEDSVVPCVAMESIVRRVSDAMGELGLKARIEAENGG